GDILKRLAMLAPVPPADISKMVQDLRARTLSDIQHRCGTIRFLTTERPIDLGEVYTDVNILEKRTAYLRKTREELIKEAGAKTFERFGGLVEKTERIPGLQVFEKHRRIIVYGKPGAGKTTFLKRLAMQCAGGKFREDLVPVFVTLMEFAETEGSPDLLRY